MINNLFDNKEYFSDIVNAIDSQKEYDDIVSERKMKQPTNVNIPTS